MVRFNWQMLCATKPRQAYLVCCPEGEVDNFVFLMRKKALGVVCVIRGQRCAQENQCLAEWAAALQFPWYFGHNWDAFDECIADLEWWDASCYLVIVTNIDRVLAHSERDFRILLDILHGRMREDVPFHVMFHCSEEYEATVFKRLEGAGVRTIRCSVEPEKSK